jgi:hypothetical protein
MRADERLIDGPPHPEEAAKPPSRRMGGPARSRVYPRSAILSAQVGYSRLAVPLILRDAAQRPSCAGCGDWPALRGSSA